MTQPHSSAPAPTSAAADPWTPLRLVGLAVVTLTVAFLIINYISDLGLKASLR